MKRKVLAVLLMTIMVGNMIPATVFAETNEAAESSEEDLTEAPIVETTHGKIKGEICEDCEVYRGIPYGGNVDGENRFQASQPAKDWTGIRDCTINGPIAYQHSQSISGSPDFGPYFSGQTPEVFGCENEVEDENCLALNVVTPKTDQNKRPVIVYIHGGGFNTGSGSLVLGSETMVKDEDVVMVGVNQRLNVFGYLYLGGFDEKYADSGVAGLTDLRLALQWVQDNIEKFGGDPSNVTIMGESGGAAKVCNLMAMKDCEGLFNKAIMESGAGVVGNYTKEEATEVAQQVLDNLGVSPDHLEELAQFSSEQIFRAADGLSFKPVADEKNIMLNESGKIEVYDWSSDIPVLVGCSEDEMGAFTSTDVLDEITWDNLADKLVEAGTCTEENVENVINVYKEKDTKNIDAGHMYLKISSSSGFLSAGAYDTAVARAEAATAPVYEYIVAYDSGMALNADYKYAWHTADLPLQMRIVYYPESEEISKTMSSAWAAFARTGDPSTDNLAWPAFDLKNQSVMILDDTCEIQSNPWQDYRDALAK